MGHNTLREVTTVGVGPYGPDTVGRMVGAWGLGDHGYDLGGEPEVVVVEYLDRSGMDAADRPLGFGVAMASAVEVQYTGQEQ